jgi:hypothetical protein
MINLKDHPTLAWAVDYWPSVVLVPTILLVIAVLALVTHRWDRRDESAPERQRVVLHQQPVTSSRRCVPAGRRAVRTWR